MWATDVAGSWGQAAALPDPGDSDATPGVEATSVSCTAVSNCVAVGNYLNASDDISPLIETETNGTWVASSGVSTPLNSGGLASLSSVSCPASNNCTAVGLYEDTSDVIAAFEITLSNGTWGQAEQLTPPADAYPSDPAAIATGVSCWAPGSCMVVGAYDGASDTEQGFGLFDENGVFGTAVADTAAYNEESPRADLLNGVSCVAMNVCVAVGAYTDSTTPTPVTHGFIEVFQFGEWAPQVMQDPKYFEGAGILNGVSCAPSGSCVSTGSFSDGATLEMHAKLYTFVGNVLSSHVTQTGPHTATFSWTPSPVSGAGVKSFVPELSSNGGSNYNELPFPLTGPPTTSSSATGLVAGHPYKFEVLSVSRLDQIGISPAISFTPAGPPSAPRSPHATATAGGARLSWAAPASTGGLAIKSYKVTITWAGGSKVLVEPGTVLHAAVTGLSHTKAYHFTVTAIDVAGTSPASASTHFTPLA
jgi:hypothetical protein